LEKILVFQVNESDLRKLKEITQNLRIRLLTVEKCDFRQTIGDLLDQKKNPAAGSYEGVSITESMIVMNDFTDKRMDALLKALKREQVAVDYKAIVTPFNKKWTALQLYFEMEKEKRAYMKSVSEKKQ